MARRYTGIRTAEGKSCTECKRILPFNSFRNNKTESDGLTHYCRDCLKARERQRYQDGHGAKVQSVRKELKLKYIEKMGGQCVRCGYGEFVSGLDFHHTEDKENTIATLMGCAIQGNLGPKHIATLEQELAKCVVLCSNCHRGIHAGEWALTDPTYTKRTAFTPSIEYRTDELAYLPLFENA